MQQRQAQTGEGSHLNGFDGGLLITKVRFVALRDLTHEALERQLADEQLRGLLVLADLTSVAVYPVISRSATVPGR